MSYLEKEQALQAMVGSGEMIEAFDKYYNNDVVMIEATGEVREGKANNRTFELEWMAGIAEVHGGGVHAITSNEELGVTMTETWIDASFKDGSRMKMEEVSVKQWQNGLIIKERFYYNTETSSD